MCVDDGFDLNPSKNRSFIGHEYINNIVHGSMAFAVVVQLGISGRIRKLPKRVDRRTGKQVCQIIRNKLDRVFIKVTCNSQSRTLVSHDFNDFSRQKRTNLAKCVAISVITAQAAENLL